MKTNQIGVVSAKDIPNLAIASRGQPNISDVDGVDVEIRQSLHQPGRQVLIE
jgi:hypothetical protein